MKKAIVVGATSGIGRGIAKILVENGYFVGITGRREELLLEIKRECEEKYFHSAFDVCETGILSGKLTELCSELGGLDLIIISSGTGEINPDLDFVKEKKTIDTNVLGFTAVTDWAFRYFDSNNGGHIVAISSIAGLRGNRQAPAYNATKAYQINYLEGLRQKASKISKNIFITDIRPGFVDTAMAQGGGLFWVAGVEKAARQIFLAIQKRKPAAYITRRWSFIAVILRFLPGWIYKRL